MCFDKIFLSRNQLKSDRLSQQLLMPQTFEKYAALISTTNGLRALRRDEKPLTTLCVLDQLVLILLFYFVHLGMGTWKGWTEIWEI